MHRSAPNAIVLAAAVIVAGCREREAGRRDAAEATAAAEQIASEGTLTSATVEIPGGSPDEERARGETIAAFQLEQADHRARLQRALDALDKDVVLVRKNGVHRDVRLRELRVRRALLKGDLDAVDRSTEPDWATLRTKVDRDLGGNSSR
jgi:hypothetical protein